MSKVNNLKNIPLKDILSQVKLSFRIEDISKFCKNNEIAQVITSKIKKGEINSSELLEYENDIHKDILVFISWLRDREDIIKLEKELEILIHSKKDSISIQEKRFRINQLRENLRIERRLCKGLDIYLSTANVDKQGYLFQIEAISSKEEFGERSYIKEEKENTIIFDKLEATLNGESSNTGMDYVLQCVEAEDIYKVLPANIARAVIYRMQANTMYLCKSDLEKSEQLKKYEKDNSEIDIERLKINYSIREKAVIPEMKESLRDVIKYVDLKKLLLIAIYRLEEVLETENISEINNKKEDIIRSIIGIVKTTSNFIDKDMDIEIGNKRYTYQDAITFLSRLDDKDGGYATKAEVQQLKEDLLNGEDIVNISTKYTFMLRAVDLSDEELREVMRVSKENFAFGIIKMNPLEQEMLHLAREYKENWSHELTEHFFEEGRLSIPTILELFYIGALDAEFFKEFSEENDISSEINLSKIKEQYFSLKKQKEPKQEDVDKLNKMIELYKLVNIDEKTREELEELSYEVMYEIAEDFEDESDISFYYEKGLVTLSTVAEWSGESLIQKLYDESKISFEDLENLYKSNKIGINLIQKNISIEGIEYSTLISYIRLRYIDENKIINLYMEGKLFDADFEQIAIEGVIGLDKYYDATSKRTKETLEENARIKFKPVLVNIPDKKVKVNLVEDGKESEYSDTDIFRVNKNKTLIDPNARYEFLKLLGAKEAEAVILDEDNAFYNYEFFVIPDSQGNLQEDSVVIAERFYEDKEQMDKFATDNATYFFQYKDLMVNSNLSKKEMTQDRDNIVFTASHRAGSWAVTVLYRIAQTMAGDNLKQYKRGDEKAERILDELHRIYTAEEIGKILELTRRIDDTNEYIYEEVNSVFGKRKENIEEDDGER